jgi:hypothetical protein
VALNFRREAAMETPELTPRPGISRIDMDSIRTTQSEQLNRYRNIRRLVRRIVEGNRDAALPRQRLRPHLACVLLG